VARAVTIDAQPFTPNAWSPFGWVPVPDTDHRDAVHALAFQWGDAHLNFIDHSPEEIVHSSQGPIVQTLYRHDSHTQALMPVNVEAVIAVAPALNDFSNPTHLDGLRAFLVRRGEIFVLHKGTWHWGPYPLGNQTVRLLNLQGKRYKEDNTSIDLAKKLDVRVAIRLPRMGAEYASPSER
jgi:ureidoglycolate hydrolase